MSKDGAFVESQDSPTPGCQLRLSVRPSSEKSAASDQLTISGTVRHSGTLPLGDRTLHGFGFKFEPQDRALQDQISRLLDAVAWQVP